MAFSDGTDDVTRVRESTDLVELVGEHVSLVRKGREHACLCPFHDDRNPSMYVSSVKQIYKCFACGAGGDCFEFMMRYHRLTFREALERLAERAHVELTRSGPKQEGPSPRQRMAEATQRAAEAYQGWLVDSSEGKQARDYLTSRGVSDEMVKRFQIGYAPDQWDALSRLAQQKRWDIEPLHLAGLLSKGRNGDLDKMRHRLIFPIHDELGRVLAFGGRALEGSTRTDPTADAKYLNSPETELFHKGGTLYGLHQAAESIKKCGDGGTAVLVEGYMDVVACHQHGVENVVAALGTAFTSDHAKKLRRYCNRIIFLFDGDAAGQKAAARGAEVLLGDRAAEIMLAESLDVNICVLPDNMDPDDYLKAHGADAFRECVNQSQDAFSWLLRRVANEVGEEGTLAGEQRVLDDFVQRLVNLGAHNLGGSRLSRLVVHLADKLHIPEQNLHAKIMEKARSRQRPRVAEDLDSAQQKITDDPRQLRVLRSAELIVGAVLTDPELLNLTVQGGASLDEALPAGAMPEAWRETWSKVLDGLMRFKGQGSALSALCTEASAGGDDLWRTQMLQAETAWSDLVRSLEDSNADANVTTKALRDAVSNIVVSVSPVASHTRSPLERIRMAQARKRGVR